MPLSPSAVSQAPVMARIMRSTGAGGKAHTTREMARPMTRSAWVAAVVALATVACASDAVPGAAPVSGPAPPLLPDSALSRMTSETTPVDADRLANEVAHPDDLRAVLADAGFVRAAQRSFGAGTGRPFSRVLARGLAFGDEAGAAAFVTWFAEHAPAEIIRSERIDPVGVPDGVVTFRHLPDGCCHNDVPVFLAAWQRGSTVLFLHAGGRSANGRAFAELIATYDQEV
jgi:hypothetical protein